jgi:FkbM family methyltransferase
MAAPTKTFRTVKVRHPVRFDVVIDPAANDPVAQSLIKELSPRRFFRRWFRPRPVPVPHLDLLLQLVRPGDKVLDLGAHLGTFSLAAAAAKCNVLAVEASPANAALLEESVRRNRFDRMRLIQAAASNAAGIVEFCPFGPFGHVSTSATQLPRVPVRAVQIDDLLEEVGWQQVAFIKMDIEGSELAALHGMKRLLGRSDAPPILFESNAYALGFYGATPAQLLAALHDFGYRIFLADPDRLVRVEAEDFQPEVVIDYLAIKRVPETLPHWQTERPATRREMVERVAKALQSQDPLQREHIRSVLTRAPSWLQAPFSV